LNSGVASSLVRVLPSTGEFALLQDSSDNEIVGKTISLLFYLIERPS
jgi:hypothetical protein